MRRKKKRREKRFLRHARCQTLRIARSATLKISVKATALVSDFGYHFVYEQRTLFPTRRGRCCSKMLQDPLTLSRDTASARLSSNSAESLSYKVHVTLIDTLQTAKISNVYIFIVHNLGKIKNAHIQNIQTERKTKIEIIPCENEDIMEYSICDACK